LNELRIFLVGKWQKKLKMNCQSLREFAGFAKDQSTKT